MNRLMLAVSFLFVVPNVFSGDLVFASDHIFPRYYLGQNVAIGVLIQNTSDESRTIDLFAYSDLSSDYLRPSAAKIGVSQKSYFFSERISIKPGEAVTRLIHPMQGGWNKEARYDISSLDFEVEVIVDSDGERTSKIIYISVERPTSKRGLEIWNRYLAADDFRYHYISAATIRSLMPSINYDLGGRELGRQLSSEYSDEMVVGRLATADLQSWKRIADLEPLDLEVEFDKRRAGVGAYEKAGVHPAECLAIAIAESRDCEDVSESKNKIIMCSKGNEYFEALANFFIYQFQAPSVPSASVPGQTIPTIQ